MAGSTFTSQRSLLSCARTEITVCAPSPDMSGAPQSTCRGTSAASGRGLRSMPANVRRVGPHVLVRFAIENRQPPDRQHVADVGPARNHFRIRRLGDVVRGLLSARRLFRPLGHANPDVLLVGRQREIGDRLAGGEHESRNRIGRERGATATTSAAPACRSLLGLLADELDQIALLLPQPVAAPR